MKQIVFTPYFLPHKNGIANYILTTSKELEKLGIKTVVITSNTEGEPEEETIEGIKIYRVPTWNLLSGTFPIPKPFGPTNKLLAKIDWKNSPVVTHTRFFPITLMGGREASKRDLRWIHIEHGNKHVPHLNLLVRLIAYMWDQTLGRIIMRKADQVVAISMKGVEFTKKLGAKNPIYIPNCIDQKKFSPGKSNFRKKYGIGVKSKLISYVGRLVKEKGVQDLIAATKGMKVELVIVGDGPYRDSLEKLAKKNHTKAYFIGSADAKEIVDVLRAADVFVNPSYAEGLPTSVLEAASVGVPVIATDVGGTSEIVEKYLYKPGDVRRLSELLSRRVSVSARELTSFSGKQVAKDLYDALLSIGS